MDNREAREDRIARRITAEARKSIDIDGATNAVMPVVKGMMKTWNVGDSAIVDLFQFGYPKGWKAELETVTRPGEPGILISCKTGNKARGLGGAAFCVRSAEPHGDDWIRKEIKWVMKNTLH